MFCENCGAKLEENDKFCFECGHPTAEDEEYKIFKAAEKQTDSDAEKEPHTEKVCDDQIKKEAAYPGGVKVDLYPRTPSAKEKPKPEQHKPMYSDSPSVAKATSYSRDAHEEVPKPEPEIKKPDPFADRSMAEACPGAVKVEETPAEKKTAVREEEKITEEKTKKKKGKGFVIAMIVIGIILIAAAFVCFKTFNVAGSLIGF